MGLSLNNKSYSPLYYNCVADALTKDIDSIFTEPNDTQSGVVGGYATTSTSSRIFMLSTKPCPMQVVQAMDENLKLIKDPKTRKTVYLVSPFELASFLERHLSQELAEKKLAQIIDKCALAK